MNTEDLENLEEGSQEEEYHQCHFCGGFVKDGKEADGKKHWLSDCRPDLVEHEIGDTCTWAFKRNEKDWEERSTCYAYKDSDGNWTTEHEHFYPDGPM